MTVTTNTLDRPKSVCYTFEGASKNGFLLQRIKIYRDNGGLLPDAHLHLVGKKNQRISDRIKGHLVAAFRSPLMKALDTYYISSSSD